MRRLHVFVGSLGFALLCSCGTHSQPRSTLNSVIQDGNDTVGPGGSNPSAPGQPLLRGRFDMRDPNGPMFAWPNSAIAVGFTGTSLAISLADQPGTDNNRPVDTIYDVVIDGNAPYQLTAQPNAHIYPLAQRLPAAQHTAWVIKRTEANVGLAQFLGFTVDANATLTAPPPLPNRRVEFIGDSELTGYGNEASVTHANMCTFSPDTENAQYNIPQLTANALHADFINLAYSGKGIATNLDSQDPATLPMLYGRALPNDPASGWDFSRWTADVVVLDAGGNDLQGDPSDPNSAYLADPTQFVQEYAGLLQTIRQHYPHAAIFCVLSSAAQDQERTALTNPIMQAIAAQKAAGDANIFFFDYFANDPTNHCYDDAAVNLNLQWGCDYHPSRAGSQFLAGRLATAIAAQMGW